MAFPRPSYTEIEQRIWNKVRANTTITANLDSSAIGVLVKVVAAEFDTLWAEYEKVANNSQLTTAEGPALDVLGLDLGVPRRADRSASTSGLARAVRFTNSGVASVIVPSGTRVFKDSNPQIAYFTTEGVTISTAQSAEVHVTAASPGELYNVGIGELNRHNVPNVSVTVTNILPIETGSFQESDTAYRERLIQEFRRRRVLNLQNLDALLRSVPGVQDVYIINQRRGAGTFDAIIIPRAITSLTAVVDECNRLLVQNVPAGISGIARAPQYKQLDVQINLRFSPSSNVDRERVRESIRQQVRARVDNLPVEDGSGNGSLFIGQLQALAGNADTSVLEASGSFGLDGSPLSSSGEIRLATGQRIILRSLEVN